MAMKITPEVLNSMQPWGILKVCNKVTGYNVYAIKRPDNTDRYYIYDGDEVVNDYADISSLLEYESCVLVDTYEDKEDAICTFDDLFRDHEYLINDYFFDGDWDSIEEEDY